MLVGGIVPAGLQLVVSMAMNRQTKRMLQKQGQLGADGESPAPRRDSQRPTPKPRSERTSALQYVREARGELRKVAWPDRSEILRYSVIVLATMVILTTFIFGLDYVVAKGIFFLFDS